MGWFSRDKTFVDEDKSRVKNLSKEQKKELDEVKKRIEHAKKHYLDAVGAFLQKISFTQEIMSTGSKLDKKTMKDLKQDIQRIGSFYEKKMNEKEVNKYSVTKPLLRLVNDDFMIKFLKNCERLLKGDKKVSSKVVQQMNVVSSAGREFKRRLTMLVRQYHSLTGGRVLFKDKRGHKEYLTG